MCEIDSKALTSESTTLILIVIDAKYLEKNMQIVITPNTVNHDKIYNFQNNLDFGKEDKLDVYKLDQEYNSGEIQFSIEYDRSIRNYKKRFKTILYQRRSERDWTFYQNPRKIFLRA